MPVALRRRDLCGCAGYRIRARWHDHGCSGMADRNIGVDIVAVVGTIAGDGRHYPLDPVEQGTDLGAVVGILVGQHRGDDPAGIGVRREMQHSPGPAPLEARSFNRVSLSDLEERITNEIKSTGVPATRDPAPTS